MSEPIELQSWWSQVVPELKRRRLRDIASERQITVSELEAAIARTGVMAATETPEASARDRLAALRDRLGQVSDGEISKLAGVARKTVVEYRKLHEIPAYVPPGGGGNPRKVVRTRGKVAKVQAEPEASGGRVRVSKLDGFLDIVGQLPDKVVAERAGVTAENVRMYRVRRGIAAQWRPEDAPRRGRPRKAAPVEPAAPKRRGRPPRAVVEAREAAKVSAPAPQVEAEDRRPRVEDALAPFLDRIGKVSDAEVATAAGVSRSAVSAYRLRHQIAAAGKGGRPRGSRNKPRAEAVAPVAAAPAAKTAPVAEAVPVAKTAAPVASAPARGIVGWAAAVRVGGAEQTWTVLATDPVEAARLAWQAASAAGAELLGIRSVGPVIGA
jgi:hypothetical protein